MDLDVKRVRTRLTALVVGCLPLLATAEIYDLVVRGGRVVDGTGAPAFFADVAVKAGRIVAVGRVTGDAEVVLEVRGLVVAPGFIDVHTHGEEVLTLPAAENFVRQGVTTIVAGNCGSSVTNVAEFFRRLEATNISVNVATLVGHGTIRNSAMGGSFARAPTDGELERMKSLVEQGMRDGALGLSTGLIYLPGTFATTDEIVALAKVAATHDGIYATHMRNEGLEIQAALAETFRIAREAGIRAQISHLKLAGKASWGRATEILGIIEKARDAGLDITQDQYVYPASSTGISTVIPEEVREGGRAQFAERLRDSGRKAAVTEQMKAALRRNGRDDYRHCVIADYAADRSLNGLDVGAAARKRRDSDSLSDQIELIFEMHANGGATAVFHGMSEDDVQVFLRHPNTMIASDSGIRKPGEGVPHPRGYGNNARVLGRYVRELKLIRLEEAVRRMTSLPAATFRLRERGMLVTGNRADLVAFDPATVRDTATFDAPHQFPEGMPHVVVNGALVVRDGRPTGARPGRAIRLNESANPP